MDRPERCTECGSMRSRFELFLGTEKILCSECNSVIAEPVKSLENEQFAIVKGDVVRCAETGKEICEIEW